LLQLLQTGIKSLKAGLCRFLGLVPRSFKSLSLQRRIF
jgi:hypothetical protein